MSYHFLFECNYYKFGKVYSVYKRVYKCILSNFKVASNFSSSNGGKPPMAESLASFPEFELPPALVLRRHLHVRICVRQSESS